MCGIAGIVNLNREPVSPIMLKKMTDSMVHRGPDNEGFYVDGHVGLGHRRLSIIDLSPAGNQPMSSPDGSLVISYNGEIFNYQELRVNLQSRGHIFKSRTDTEIVLHAYMEWGPECLGRFNGMFALAIWDRNRQEIFIARDRYGIKPLYYAVLGQTFLFASEHKAFLSHPAMHRALDQEALTEYFTFQNLFTDRTLIKGVKILPAGCWAVVSAAGKNPRLNITQYWDYNFASSLEKADEEEYVEELDRLFVQAVNRQLVSDVEIGSYLSGGMDSGSITAIAARNLPYIKTFTCGFDLSSASGLELGFDEREKAEYMSYLYKTEHYEMVLKAGDMERIMPSVVWHLEEPRVGQSYPNYYVARLASKFTRVVLSGAGGDELFGGYPWRYYRAVVNQSFEDYIDKYYDYWQRLIPSTQMPAIFAPIWPEAKNIDTRSIFKGVFKHHSYRLYSSEDYINHSLYFEAKTFLHGLLVVEDKLSMAHSLETRVPFLDNDLVDFAMGLPVSLKLHDLQNVIRINENEGGLKKERYYQKTSDGKLLLRRVMNNYIPPVITNAVKQGFSAPDSTWFKGDSIEYVRRKLYSRTARIYDYMDYDAVIRLVDEHMNGTENRRLLIWSLLNFEWWLRLYLD